MTVEQLKKELEKYPSNADVKIVYSAQTCDGYHEDGSYCYCPYEEHEESISYLCPKEQSTRKNPNPVVKTVLIYES